MLEVWEEDTAMQDRDTELKPCPFCGGEAEVYAQAFNKYSVICSNCYCVKGSYGTKEKAIEEWNRRNKTWQKA